MLGGHKTQAWRVDVGTGVIVRKKYAWGAGSSRHPHVPEPWCLSSPLLSVL